MNTMQLTNDRDRVLFAVTLVPVLLLVAFVAIAAIEWSRNDAAVHAKLRELVPQEVLNQPTNPNVLKQYGMTVDRGDIDQATLVRHAQATRAIGLLSYEVDYLQSLEGDAVSYGFEFNSLPRLTEIYQRAEPAIEVIRSHLELFHGTGTHDFFRSKFNYHIRQRDFEQAIESLKLALREANTAIDTDIATAMTQSGWKIDQIETIERLVAESSSSRVEGERSSRMIEMGAVLQSIEWLKGDQPTRYYNNYETSPYPVAGSTRLAVLQFQIDAASMVGDRATIAGLKKQWELEEQFYETVNHNIDTALQIPFYNVDDARPLRRRPNIEWRIRLANNKRFAKTAIAIRKFELLRGHFPESISELSGIGFPPSEAVDVTGQTFKYQDQGQSPSGGAILGNSSEGFDGQRAIVWNGTAESWRRNLTVQYMELFFAGSRSDSDGSPSDEASGQ
ncbi:hypothetical protein U8335_13050 [Roseiconus lacunae]|uniref:hypothetical protein n=1 Tax=Roseiconus lacunae TaxID=2605694 RepID=UPI00308848E3|nr:hypothetical protein U8335_13050 [Stieleria sp. HD01]